MCSAATTCATPGRSGSSFGRGDAPHGLRNGAVPVISILGIELATTFLGAVVVESVFALPGLGSMLLKAIAQHDYPNIQGILFVSTLRVLSSASSPTSRSASSTRGCATGQDRRER